MPSAQGSVKSLNGSQLQCVFVINNIERRFVGTINPAVSQFLTTQATLTYDSISSLIGTKTFGGTLGIDDVAFVVGDDNAVSVSGKVITPVRPPVNMNGVGTWTASADD